MREINRLFESCLNDSIYRKSHLHFTLINSVSTKKNQDYCKKDQGIRFTML